MSRYIDADRLTEAFVKAAKQVGNIGDQIAFRMMINEIPAADVRENVRGEWIKIHWKAFRCSECKGISEYYTDFCPNCGCLMKGEEE